MNIFRQDCFQRKSFCRLLPTAARWLADLIGFGVLVTITGNLSFFYDIFRNKREKKKKQIHRNLLFYEFNYPDQKIQLTLRATYKTTGQLFRPY